MEALGSETGVHIQVEGPERVGQVAGQTLADREKNAEALARKVNAHVLLYGTIQRAGDMVTLAPEFYVNIQQGYETAELAGQHRLGDAILVRTTAAGEQDQVALDRELTRRSQVLSLVTKGLSLHFAFAYEDALAFFEQANDDSLWDLSSGRETLYLFEGNAAARAGLLERAEAAYLRAVEIDPEYARAYIGLGSVYYTWSLQGTSSQSFEPNAEDQQQALAYFDQALQAQHKPPLADIETKAAFGRAEVYLSRWLAGSDAQDRDEATRQFQAVIDAHSNGQNPRLQDLASEAWARLGLIARQQGEHRVAVEKYVQAHELASIPGRRAVFSMTLADLHGRLGQPDEARTAYEAAVREYRFALALTSQGEHRAAYLAEMARAYERLDDRYGAVTALREAANLLPPDSEKLAEIQERLAALNAP
jgi:tetratricopeptide (TPR) repeat protein